MSEKIRGKEGIAPIINKARMVKIIREKAPQMSMGIGAYSKIVAEVEELVRRSVSAALEDGSNLLQAEHVVKAGVHLFGEEK